MNQAAQEAQSIARWPIHPKRPYKVQNMHEPTTTKLNDPYHWVREMTAEDRDLFKREEEEYYRLSLLKNDFLHKQLVREQEFYQQVQRVLPLRIGDYIYYRRVDNPADAITLYRFPLDELKRRGYSEGEVPQLMTNPDGDPTIKEETIDEFPEEVVFSIGDLKEYYQNFATKDERIKDFVERVTDQVVT